MAAQLLQLTQPGGDLPSDQWRNRVRPPDGRPHLVRALSFSRLGTAGSCSDAGEPGTAAPSPSPPHGRIDFG